MSCGQTPCCVRVFWNFHGESTLNKVECSQTCFFPLCLHEASLNHLIQAGESITIASPVCIWASLWKKISLQIAVLFIMNLSRKNLIISDTGYLLAITQRLALVTRDFYVLYLIYCRPYIFYIIIIINLSYFWIYGRVPF